MKSLLVGFMMLVVSVKVETLKPVFDREWKFPDGSGNIVIGLSYISPKDPHVFSLTIIGKDAEPNISKEAVCLESVLSEMKGKGMFPEKLWTIYAEFGGVNARELALAASKATEWKDAANSDYAKVVVQLLNAADVYAPFNVVLEKYGLSIRVGAAEYISLSKPNAFGLKNSDGRLLPSGASVQLVAKHNPPR